MAVCLLAATACSSDGDETTEPPETAPSTDAPTTDAPATAEPETEEPAVTASSDDGGASVSVVLTDGDVVLDPTSTDAGSVEIVAKNVGGDLHDLVIVKGDDPAALPVNENGAVIEDDLPEGDFIGRIDVVEAGTEESASFDLDAGSYILFCNIENPTAILPLPISHFEDGMVSTFTVI